MHPHSKSPSKSRRDISCFRTVKCPRQCPVSMLQSQTELQTQKRYQALNILQTAIHLVANSNTSSPHDHDSSSPHNASPPSALPRRPSRRWARRRPCRRLTAQHRAANGDPPSPAVRRAAAILIRAHAIQPHAAAHVHPPRLTRGKSAEAVAPRRGRRLGRGRAHDRWGPAPVVAADAVCGRGRARVACRCAVAGCGRGGGADGRQALSAVCCCG
jgi:hypothetical protein